MSFHDLSIKQLTAELTVAQQEIARLKSGMKEHEALRDLLDNMNEVLYTIDPSGKVTFVCSAIQSLAKYSPSEVIGRSAEEFLHEEDVEKFRKEFGSILAGKKVSDDEYRIITGSGNIRWVQTSMRPIFEENEITGVQGLFLDITDHKMAEDKLRESEARYRSIFHNNHAVMLLIDPENGKIIDANKAACDYYGYALDELRNLEISDINILTPDQIQMEMQLAKSTRRKHFFFQHRLADGQIRDVQVFSGPVFVDGRETLYSIIHDITDRKRAESELVETEQKYRELVRHAPAAILEVNFRNMRFTTVNEAMCHMSGYSREELLNMSPYDILDEESQNLLRLRVNKWLKGEEPEKNVEYRVINKDGRVIDAILDTTFTADENGRPLGSRIVAHDITARKQEERRIIRYNNILSGINRIFETVIRAETEADLGRTCLDVAIEITGSEIGFIGEIGPDGFNHDIAVSETGCRVYDKTGHRRKPGSFPIRGLYGRILKDGKGFYTNDPTSSPDSIGLPQGHPPLDCFLGVPLIHGEKVFGNLAVANRKGGYAKEQQTDLEALAPAVIEALLRKRAEDMQAQWNEKLEQQVTERTELAENRAKQLQSLAVELVEAEERERQRIAGWLHDDLQQLLAAARFNLQGVSKDMPHSALSDVDLLLEESIEKSRSMSYQLGPPVLHQFGLAPALEWIVGRMDEQFGLKIDLKLKADLQNILTSQKIFLFRAVQELLFNVYKHSGVKSASIALAGDNDHITVSVQDHGSGFDTRILKTAVKEAGLGLLSLKERTHALGGRLEINSSPGQGSHFLLTIPIRLSETAEPKTSGRKEKTQVKPEAVSDIDADSNIRVLFCDDHQVMRQGLIGLIGGQPDIQVVGEAADGEEALELARQIRPDVIMMDISMPKMDGIEATRRIKAEMPSIRVIGLSMFDDDATAQKMQQAGVDGFVSKNQSSSELLEAIYNVVGQE
jgi:PAS domain S-box-containing protein